MITDLEEILNLEELTKLLNALNQNKNYHYSNGEVTIDADSIDNALSILIEFKKKDLLKNELNEFQDYLGTLDDNLFIEVCEFLGEENIQRIQDCLNSKDIESVRAGILKFKKALSDLAKERIKFYKQYE